MMTKCIDGLPVVANCFFINFKNLTPFFFGAFFAYEVFPLSIFLTVFGAGVKRYPSFLGLIYIFTLFRLRVQGYHLTGGASFSLIHRRFSGKEITLNRKH